MKLARLVLDNYKQYAGHHEVEFPEGGVVAVVGANGVGKTTLFEAIEWCLYNPARIKNDEVPPRGAVGATRVEVTLLDPARGDRWVVARWLDKRGVNAEVYKEDDPGASVATGTTAVTDYVERKLVGLGHKAFVSTFFTRQKELSFFGDVKATDRRREVARLLGHDAIRRAQELVAEERRDVDAAARQLALQATGLAGDRDFATETAIARERVTAAELAAAEADRRHVDAEQAATAAAADLDHLRGLSERHHVELVRLEAARGRWRVLTADLDAARRRLVELDLEAQARAAQAALAATAPARQEALRQHEREQERDRRARELQDQERRAAEALAATERHLAGQVMAVRDGQEFAGWQWDEAAAADPVRGAGRLLDVIAGLAVDDACAHLAALERCRGAIVRRDEAEQKLLKFRRRRADLERQAADLCQPDDPRQALEAARRAGRAADAEAARAAAAERAAADEAARLKRQADSLRRQPVDQPCPTCHRPLDRDQVARMIADFERQREDAGRRATAAAGEREAAERRAAASAAVEAAAQTRAGELAKIEGAIEKSVSYLAEAEEEAEALSESAAAALAACRLTTEPTEQEVAVVKHRVGVLQELQRAEGRIAALQARAEEAVAARQDVAAALAALGPVTYDPACHRAAAVALSEAVAAEAVVRAIDQRLTARPKIVRELANAEAAVAGAAVEVQAAEDAVAAIGFDQAALEAAKEVERQAAAAREAARTAAQAAADERRAAGEAWTGLVALEAQVRDLEAQAIARRREADDLLRVREEFNRFDQYVAARVGPVLADRTAEFLTEVTDGKYARVAFDQDYGMRIYDDDEAFPIERFSGGERDVAALCARLALSTMVGGQAANPPRFAVLDEVFGSLDEERRAQVLGTLGKLAETSEALQQLFIISHVEDVHASPVVGEVWRIREVDGVSRIEKEDERARLALVEA